MNDRFDHALLVLLLLAHLALLSNQPEGQGGPLEGWLLKLFGPVGRAVTSGARGVEGVLGAVKTAGALRRENEHLRSDMESARRELVRLHGIEEELERLRRHAEYSRTASGESYVADVVFVDPTSWLRTLVIHTGGEQARPNQPVVTDAGLVGRIMVPSGNYAKVQLVTDRSAAASVMIRRTRRQGLIRGRGGERLSLDDIPIQSDVRIGDQVLTAGLDGVYPRGLPVGRVSSVATTQGLFHRIEVAPTVDFGLLDQVYVLTDDLLPRAVQQELLAGEEAGGGGAP